MISLITCHMDSLLPGPSSKRGLHSISSRDLTIILMSKNTFVSARILSMTNGSLLMKRLLSDAKQHLVQYLVQTALSINLSSSTWQAITALHALQPNLISLSNNTIRMERPTNSSGVMHARDSPTDGFLMNTLLLNVLPQESPHQTATLHLAPVLSTLPQLAPSPSQMAQ